MSNNSLTHAYIVRSGTASSPFVTTLISELLCSSEADRPCGECVHCNKITRGIHPDVTVIKKLQDKKEIQVDQIREAVFSARLMPNEAERRVIVIDGADDMNANAQNALLKLLEEPPAHIILLLIAASPGALLPTVRSRCRTVEAGVPPGGIPEEITELASRYFRLASLGGVKLVELSFELEKIEKRDFAIFLSEVRQIAANYLRSELVGGKSVKPLKRAREIIDTLKTAEEYLLRNVSIMHISALLCAFSERLD